MVGFFIWTRTIDTDTDFRHRLLTQTKKSKQNFICLLFYLYLHIQGNRFVLGSILRQGLQRHPLRDNGNWDSGTGMGFWNNTWERGKMKRAKIERKARRRQPNAQIIYNEKIKVFLRVMNSKPRRGLLVLKNLILKGTYFLFLQSIRL